MSNFFLSFLKNFLPIRILVIIFLSFSSNIFSQTPIVMPTPPEVPIKISTEEVHLNVIAQNTTGKPVPNLKIDDLLVVEEGDPQTITSIKKIPASILLLLDTGSEINFIKKVSTTRLLAKTVLYSLSNENEIALMQYYNKIELLSDWTKDFSSINTILDRKLYSGKRTRFSDALNSAINVFKNKPIENRHIVIITDGLENVANDEARQSAIQNLIAANITVHILSYTQLEKQSAEKAARPVKIGDGKTKPNVDPMIWDEIVKGLSSISSNGVDIVAFREHIRMLNEAQPIVIIDLDRARRKKILEKRDDWEKSEIKLQNIAEDTGGEFQAPEELSTLFKLAIQTASAIDSSYVITYIPTKPVADSNKNEPRKVRVSSHLNGVYIRSRHKVIWNQNNTDEK